MHIRVLQGLSSRVLVELELDRQAPVIEIMMGIQQEKGLHWRRQKLLHNAQALGEAQIIGDVLECPADVSLVHIDHRKLEPISDPETLQVLLQADPEALQFATKELQSDKDLVLAAVRRGGKALRFASNALRNDEEVAELAIASDVSAFCVAGKAVRKSHRFAKKACGANVDNVRWCHPELLADNGFLLPFVAKCGGLLRFALKPSVELIQAAVQQDGLALEFVADKNLTPDIVLAAVAQNGHALKFAKHHINDFCVVLEAVATDYHALRHVGNKELVIRLVRAHPEALKFAQSHFLNDVEVVQSAYDVDPSCLRFAGKEAVLQMLRLHGNILEYTKKSIQMDAEVLALAQAYGSPTRPPDCHLFVQQA